MNDILLVLALASSLPLLTSATDGAPPSAWGFYGHELGDSRDHVVELFRLHRDIGFDPAGPLRQETRDFAAERLAVGARTLRDLWWSAWLESGGAQPGGLPGL